MAYLEVKELAKQYPVKTSLLKQITGRVPVVDAVSGVSFELEHGEVVGLVGESGCGKSTLGRLLVRLENATSGSIRLGEQEVGPAIRGADIKDFRRKVQMIFQDPYDSLNPQRTVLESVMQPLRYLGIGGSEKERRSLAIAALERVELRPVERYASRLPHLLSGGQRQRVAIARALVVNPKFVVADEPVSMLDVSVRASILNLLRDLNRETGIPVLLITHDLATAGFLCDRIMVMYLGKLVEEGPADEIIENPQHPYSQLLLSSVPSLLDDRKVRIAVTGEAPSAIDPPSGCRFHPRCPFATQRCREEEPPLIQVGAGRTAACHLLEPAADAPTAAARTKRQPIG